MDGVLCVATRDGYEVSLRLVCLMVPLLALGQNVTVAVEQAAARAALSVDGINVHVAAIAETS